MFEFFARLDEKHKLLGNFEKLSKIFKSLKKPAKNPLFKHSFKRIKQSSCYLFARLDKKHKLFGNFDKILKVFDKTSIEKLNCKRF